MIAYVVVFHPFRLHTDRVNTIILLSSTQCVQGNTIRFAGVPNDQRTVPVRSCIRLDYILLASSTAECVEYLFDHVSVVGVAIAYLVVFSICFDYIPPCCFRSVSITYCLG